MVMICVAMNTSVGKQFTAGFVPGVLLAVVWCVYVYFRCRKLGVRDEKTYTREERKHVWKESVLALMYPVIVLGSIYTGFATPTEAAAIAFVYVVVIEVFVYKTMRFKDLVNACGKALVSSGSILLIIGTAGVLNWLITTMQIPATISALITANVTSKVGFLLLVGAIFFAAGQNIVLAAHAYGLGGTWLTFTSDRMRNRVRAELEIPEEYDLITYVDVGYPGQTPCAPDRISVEEAVLKRI